MWQLPRMTPNNILIYLRKSRTDDPMLTVEEVLAKHEQMLNEWVERNYPGLGGVPESNRFREVVSGETIDSRPKVTELLRKIESPLYKAILIVEPQRLSRGDLEDIGRLVKLLRYTRTIVITLNYYYDLQDEHDRDAFERELKRGNEFLEYQKRIMGNGRLLSVQNGNFIGQSPPYGYRKTVIKEGKRKCHTLEPDPETAPYVKMIFQMYTDGSSGPEIARTMQSIGAPTSRGGPWTTSGVKHILGNDHYIGMVHWNKRKTEIIVEEGEILATRPRHNEFLSFPGKHPPLIDQELWDAAQSARSAHLPIKKKSRHINPFARLVYCQCGKVMSRYQYGERSAPRLICLNQAKCKTASCTMQEFTEEIISILETEIANFDLKINHPELDTSALRAQVIEKLEKHLEDLEQQELSQWEKYTQDAMPRNIFEKLNQKLLDDRAATEQELAAARASAPAKIDYLRKRETFATALATLRDPDASVKRQNMMLRECIEKVTYFRKPKQSANRNVGNPEPLELDITFRI